MRENRTYGSEGGEAERPFLPLPREKTVFTKRMSEGNSTAGSAGGSRLCEKPILNFSDFIICHIGSILI
jgi:hypothetical protein